jgi:two-component system cell cycle response regulator
MGTADIPDSAGVDTRRILLIGDINGAFLDADAIRRLPCEIQTNIPEAIEAAAKNRFAAIAVVMSGAPAKLASALKSLKEVNSDAKIILLAQVYEEPTAMQMVSSAFNGATLADDYLICPVQTNRFYESIMTAGSQNETGLGAAVTIDATREKVKQLEKLATEDELTGLKNRRYIWEFSRQIIERARGENGRVTLLIFDIDNFKHYNDVYGHSAGDEVLKQAAVLMRRCCRGHDVVGRIGGDEFAVVFWDDPRRKPIKEEAERRSSMADHPKEAIFIAKRFRKELGKTELHLLGPEGKGVLAISGGLASFPRDGATIGELFEQADKALLDAKRSGKNKIYLVGSPQGDIAEVE